MFHKHQDQRILMKKKVFAHELIGKEIEMISSTNKSYQGIQGLIVDETKATLKVRVQGLVKTLLKSAITFKIKGSDEMIEGKSITKKPEDRIKG
jgi:ribonuclease P protein subunit POP4